MLLFPLFLSGQWITRGELLPGALAFFSFSLASSATYVVNDFFDRERDRLHPKKKNRPLASGAVKPVAAWCLVVFLMLAAFALAASLPAIYWFWFLAYLALSLAYSTLLKDQPVLDIFCIASGFVFRLFAGGAVFSIQVSDWLFLTVLLLALFLSAGKRLAEQEALGENASRHREVLKRYPAGSLEAFMLISASSVLVTYTMYAITKGKLIWSVPLCCFGLFRYIVAIKDGKTGGDPTETLLKDPMMFLVGLVWLLMVLGSVYFSV